MKTRTIKLDEEMFGVLDIMLRVSLSKYKAFGKGNPAKPSPTNRIIIARHILGLSTKKLETVL